MRGKARRLLGCVVATCVSLSLAMPAWALEVNWGGQPSIDQNADADELSVATDETGIVSRDKVAVKDEYVITQETSDVNAVLKLAKEANEAAQINAGTYEKGFTVDGITLYVNGKVDVKGGITLKNATIEGLDGRNSDSLNIIETSDTIVSGGAIKDLAVNITGSVHNFLVNWESGEFKVENASLSASGNTRGCGLFVGGGTAGSKFISINSDISFCKNVQGDGGSGIWANADGNSNAVFEFTGGSLKLNDNGLNGFMGAPAPWYGGSAPAPRFSFHNTDVEATGNGSTTSDGEGDGFSYGYISLVATEPGHVFNVSNNENNGLDGGRGNNAALNAEGYRIIANGNGNIGLNISKLNEGQSAATLIDCTVEANGNGAQGMYLKQSLTVSGSSILANGNGAEGIRFLASSANASFDESSSIESVENTGNGMYFYGKSLTGGEGASFVLTGNGNSGLTVANGIVDLSSARVEITGNHASKYGGGIDNSGTLTLPSDAAVYNNHAESYADDIYNKEGKSITFFSVGSDWTLDDCDHAIDGWYDDSEGARWAAHADRYDGNHIEEFVPNGAEHTGALSLKAAHGVADAYITPADITVYMGGSDGYDGATSDGEATGSNSLPDPGFYFTLPEEVNNAFKAAGLATEGEGADLSKYLKVYTVEEGKESNWDLARYGQDTSSLKDGKFLYHMVPADDQTDPVRLQFTDEEGNVCLDDEFNPSKSGSLSQKYEMHIYTEIIGRHHVVLEADIPATDNTGAQKIYCSLGTPSEGGTLTVRYVNGEQEDVVTDIVSTEEELADAKAQNPDGAIALLPDGTTFIVNDSGIDVTEKSQNAAPSLLFDDAVSHLGEAGDIDGQLLERAQAVAEEAGKSFKNPAHQSKYLDLVDANNGNVWLTADAPVTVYWPYPEGTDESTEFNLIHFQGLDREMENADISDEISSADVEMIEVENTKYGIRFQTTSFSPFVLTWEKSSTPSGKPSDALPGTGDSNAAVIVFTSIAGLCALALGARHMKRSIE